MLTYSLTEHADDTWWLRIDRAALVGPFGDRAAALAWISTFTGEQVTEQRRPTKRRRLRIVSGEAA
jgi:anti-sigma factor RsiW